MKEKKEKKKWQRNNKNGEINQRNTHAYKKGKDKKKGKNHKKKTIITQQMMFVKNTVAINWIHPFRLCNEFYTASPSVKSIFILDKWLFFKSANAVNVRQMFIEEILHCGRVFRLLNCLGHSSHRPNVLRQRRLSMYSRGSGALSPCTMLRQVCQVHFMEVFIRGSTNEERHCASTIYSHELLPNKVVIKLLLGHLRRSPQSPMAAHQLVEHHPLCKPSSINVVHPNPNSFLFACQIICEKKREKNKRNSIKTTWKKNKQKWH
ncbi:hypothetical protein MOQ_002904 [Trypanosoma cruzi marinkellei]|uniref:Uncharacterized protein n=1 Tax=Trypanosoma cruzi marinkellei TaxID=85056 RepID=K2N1B8_TRYCR|nr:hypothetical protein MOQ_002904 [Trypanosoma cruzi marinkellei]